MSDEERRYPPRRQTPRPETGQDYHSLMAQHGRPRGRFDLDDPRRGAGKAVTLDGKDERKARQAQDARAALEAAVKAKGWP